MGDGLRVQEAGPGVSSSILDRVGQITNTLDLQWLPTPWLYSPEEGRGLGPARESMLAKYTIGCIPRRGSVLGAAGCGRQAGNWAGLLLTACKHKAKG